MNLQESVRRILNEEFNQIRARRVIHTAKEYIENLSPKDICDYWVIDEVDHYVNGTVSEIIRMMIDELNLSNSNEWVETYEGINDILNDIGYSEEIRDFFYDSIDKCNQVIKENKLPLSFRRRLHEMDELLFELMKTSYAPHKICSYNNSEQFINHLTFDTINEHMYYKYFDHMDDLSKEWESLYRIMEEYLMNKYHTKLNEYYHINCGD
jgi:hypothetical protein